MIHIIVCVAAVMVPCFCYLSPAEISCAHSDGYSASLM